VNTVAVALPLATVPEDVTDEVPRVTALLELARRVLYEMSPFF
jgi:hypothetical protein